MGFDKSLGFILYVVGSIIHFGSEIYHAEEWSGWDPEVSGRVHIILLTSFTLIITREQAGKRWCLPGDSHM